MLAHTDHRPNPEEHPMAATLAPETPAEELARIRERFPKWGPARVLSAMGHPGYGTAFAREALARIERGNCSTHAAVYGLQGR